MINRGVVKNVTADESTIYTILGLNPYGMGVFLHNTGANEISFRFQKSLENVDSSFEDLDEDVDGYSAISGVIASGSVTSCLIISTAPYIRLLAYSAGGSVLFSAINQYSKNSSDVLSILNI